LISVSFQPRDAAVVVCHSLPVIGGKYKLLLAGGAGLGSESSFLQEANSKTVKRIRVKWKYLMVAGLSQAIG
jgi:hypothetical protein